MTADSLSYTKKAVVITGLRALCVVKYMMMMIIKTFYKGHARLQYNNNRLDGCLDDL